MRMIRRTHACCAMACALLACAGSASLNAEQGLTASLAATQPQGSERVDAQGISGARCDATQPNRESTEYDTSGDQIPDVRKVFMRVGFGDRVRLIMICRESDLNADGRKDVIRYYDDDGASVREDADRNFDGRIDMTTAYQDGRIVLRELDDNHDGKLDAKIYYDHEKPTRAERDLSGRSSENAWKPDRWEYYVDGRLVRMGTDLDGDSRVDRWDRLSQEDAKQAAAPEEPSKDGGAPKGEPQSRSQDQQGG